MQAQSLPATAAGRRPHERDNVLRRRLARDQDPKSRVAATLLGITPGGRIPTVRNLAVRFEVSPGTIHRALSTLEFDGAVSFEQRGRSGALLRERSIGKLFAAARSDPFVLALPLPTNARSTGLATAIKTLLSAEDVAAYLSFYVGSRQRLEALRRGMCDAVVISALAARGRTADEELCLELPPGSYVAEHRVYYIPRPEGESRRLRVALDRDSTDLASLAHLEFDAAEPEYVPSTFMQFIRLLASGEVDAAIWNVDETMSGRLPANVESRPLSVKAIEDLHDANTRATLITRSNEEWSNAVVRACLRAPEMLRIQADVVSGDLVPEY